MGGNRAKDGARGCGWKQDMRLYDNTPDLGQAQGDINGGSKKVLGSECILKVETMDYLWV